MPLPLNGTAVTQFVADQLMQRPAHQLARALASLEEPAGTMTDPEVRVRTPRTSDTVAKLEFLFSGNEPEFTTNHY
ncbi:hypothetical protein BJP05_00195 [Corynebacterium sp. NML98-0116]|uniref:hypothetical protein n=1 Tax=Corynebacterium sp. NML98-0116 TaxID=702967 RepID=UPI000877ECD9|nr:hypothetical protein [Corynebacterium sp. NML98-0116]AOX04777.1 hypothetical protein BJP05_00195 [Corynebacterium sp. NML98-0116]